MRRNAAAAVAAARAVGVEPAGRIEVELSAMRGQVRELGDGVTVIDDCYNANPLSMRAALDDLAQQSPAGRRVAVLGDMLEIGPTEVAEHEAIGAHAAASGVDVLVTVGPLAAAMAAPFGGEAHVVGDAAAAAELVRGLVAPGDLVLVKASRGVRLESRHGSAGGRLMGEVLVGGTASLLICVFLSPKFIEFLRLKEFGQYIREDGPQEHHAKAGTPTMGGLIIFTAITIPFLFLVFTEENPGPDRSRALGVVGVALACAALGFADDYTKIIKKRSLGLQGRTKLAVTVLISIGLWLIAREARRPARRRCACTSSTRPCRSAGATRWSSTSCWRGRRRRST